MPTVKRWNLDLHALPGWDATQQWELFEVPNADMAYIAYDIGEIGVSTDAGYLAVYEYKSDPVLIFHPRWWMIARGGGDVMCDRTGNFLLVYVANVRERREKYGFVDLRSGRFAWVFIPNELYWHRFFRIGEVQFENRGMFVSQADTEPYAVDVATLHLSKFVRRDGVDIMDGAN